MTITTNTPLSTGVTFSSTTNAPSNFDIGQDAMRWQKERELYTYILLFENDIFFFIIEQVGGFSQAIYLKHRYSLETPNMVKFKDLWLYAGETT